MLRRAGQRKTRKPSARLGRKISRRGARLAAMDESSAATVTDIPAMSMAVTKGPA